MLIWSLIFFLVAIFAAIIGFGGLYIAATLAAKIIFFIFIIFFAVTIILWFIRRLRDNQ